MVIRSLSQSTRYLGKIIEHVRDVIAVVAVEGLVLDPIMMSWLDGNQPHVVCRQAQKKVFLWCYFTLVYKYDCVHFFCRQYY